MCDVRHNCGTLAVCEDSRNPRPEFLHLEIESLYPESAIF